MKKYSVVLCLIAVLCFARIALGAGTPPPPKMTPAEIQAKCAEIDAKCAAATQAIADLLALKASLNAQLGVAPPPPAVSKSAWAEKIAISGYMQNRFEHLQANDGPPSNSPDQFAIRRAYINLIIKPNARTQGVITLGRDGADALNVTWAQAFVDYQLGKRDTVRVGQASTWFGLEEGQSSSVRLPFERAAFLDGARGRPVGLWFYGPYDRGAWWIHTPGNMSTTPQLIVGAVNGNARNNKNFDDMLTASVDLKWKPKWGIFGASWLDGEYATDNPWLPAPNPPNAVAPITHRSALDGYVRYELPKAFAAQAEGAMGRLVGKDAGTHDFRGWDLQVEKPFKNTPGTLFSRYEWYNPNTDDATHADLYHAWTFGYAHQLDTNNRLTAQLVTLAKRGTKSVNESGVQWQLGF